MKRWFVVGVVALLAVLGSGAVLAQPDPGTPTTIGDITGNASGFYGQTVQIVGTISEFISANAFVLTDGALLSNGNVLVINNTGRPIPNSFVKGQEVGVTGRVHPSYSEIFNGTFAPFPSYFGERSGMMNGGMNSDMVTPMGDATTDPNMAATPMGDATTDPNMAATPVGGSTDPNAASTPMPGMTDGNMTGMMNPYEEDLLAWAYNDMLPDEFDIYTIIELVSIDQLLQTAQAG